MRPDPPEDDWDGPICVPPAEYISVDDGRNYSGFRALAVTYSAIELLPQTTVLAPPD